MKSTVDTERREMQSAMVTESELLQVESNKYEREDLGPD